LIMIMKKKPENVKVILKIAQDMLNDICKSTNDCPLSMKFVLHYISSKANKQIPEYELPSVANIMFLRFFGIALANLKKLYIGKKIPPNNLRVGTILAKLLQQLVNNATTEGYEIITGDEINQSLLSKQFITSENQYLVVNYLLELTNEKGLQFNDLNDTVMLEKEITYNVGNSLCIIRNFISTNLEKLLIMSYQNVALKQVLLNFLQVSFSEMNIKRT